MPSKDEVRTLTDSEVLELYVEPRLRSAALDALKAARQAAQARTELPDRIATLARFELPHHVIADRIGVHRTTVWRIVGGPDDGSN